MSYISAFPEGTPQHKLEQAYLQEPNSLDVDQIHELRQTLSTQGWIDLQSAAIARTAVKNGEVIPIGQGRTEAQIAADYRARTLELLEQMVDLITEARKDHSMSISFSLTPPDAFGRCSIGMLEITKKLC